MEALASLCSMKRHRQVHRNWNFLDRVIANFRYSKVKRYVHKGDIIVDIGCGRNHRFLNMQKYRIKRGYGFDFREKNQTYDNIIIRNNKDEDGFNIGADLADEVFLNAVLEHLSEPEVVMNGIYKILKPGGRIVMTTPTRLAKPVLEFLAFKLHVINEDEILEHKHYYNEAGIENLVDELQHSGRSMKLERYRYFELFMNSLIIIRKDY